MTIGCAPNVMSWRMIMFGAMCMSMQMKQWITNHSEVVTFASEFRWQKFGISGTVATAVPISGALCVCFFAAHLIQRRHGFPNGCGKYCCESFPNMHLTRCVWVSCLFSGAPRILVNWRLFSLAGRAGVPKPAAIQLTLPMIFFAWKRMCYVLMLPINTDDNPHGHYLMIPGSITFMLWLNLSNGCASIGAETWPDVANFVCIDWLLFFLRIGMCKRFGAKTCPGLFNALLSLP